MKPVKAIPFAIASSLLFTGCNSGSSESSSNPEPTEPTLVVSGVAMDDHYLAGAIVCFDHAMDNSCAGKETAVTASDGRFSLEIPESKFASGTQIIVIPETSVQRSGKKSPASQYRSLIENTDPNDSFVISPFTTQVADRASLSSNRNLSLSIRQAQNETLEQNNFPTSDHSVVFGDFLSATGHDNFEAIKNRAYISKEWLERATERETELRMNPDYAEWESIRVFAWNVWQHSFHTHEFFERYEEYVHLQKVEDGRLIERFEGTQWFTDDEGNKLDRVLQHWSEDKLWGEKQLDIKTTFEFDYDQDGLFRFKGEKAATGTYRYNDQGLLLIDTMELYNEGDPSLEGGNEQPGREFCSDFDIVAELGKLADNAPLDQCVDFVERRIFEDSLDAQGNFIQSDLMTEWQKSKDVSSTHSVDMSSPAYYEERYTRWIADGSVNSEIYRDWDAKSENLNLDNAFNVVQKDSVNPEGKLNKGISAPGWNNPPELEFSVPGTIMRPFNQVNLASWNYFVPIYHSETVETDNTDSTTYTITSRVLNTRSKQTETGKEIQLNLPVENAAPILEASLDWNKERETLTSNWTFTPVPDGLDESIDSKAGPEKKLNVSQTLKWQNSIDNITTATQTTRLDAEGELRILSESPAFTPDFYAGQWNVTSSNLPDELMKLLFNGGKNFKFRKRIPAEELELVSTGDICWDQNLYSIDFNTLQTEGGHMVVSIRCGDGWWLRKQYQLQMTEQFDGYSFSASLMTWEDGSNSYINAPSEEYSVTFSKQL